MVEINLLDALIAKVKEAVKEIKVKTKGGEIRCPIIFDNDLPPKRLEPEEDFPFVVVHCDKSVTTWDETTSTVSFYIGCYDEKFLPHRDCLNIATRIRHVLCTLPNRILANKYRLIDPLEMENPLEQKQPQNQVVLITKWTFNSPKPEWEEL